MANGKILLFYCFTPLPDPTAIMLWQQALCEKLELRGRIIVSPDGINVTVGGELADCKAYIKATRAYLPFRELDIKWSEGSAEDFPRLSVKVRDEIVSFGAPDELEVDAGGVVGGGTHLSPEEVNELAASRDDVVFFDGRNAYEAKIGRFRDAVVPDVSTTRDFLAELDSGKYDELKDKPIVTYCTGGVRCEVLSSLMTSRGFSEVYQLDGGIVRYGEKYGNGGLWDGSLYVFDRRLHVEFGPRDDPEFTQLGECEDCGAPTNTFANRDRGGARILVLLCESCAEKTGAELPSGATGKDVV
ncbi:oxygen-dependent tRNA uridine(34) hydroxylase TrhO [Dietzia sp.]|uniref:oxygen-dependent tRNA uridine(34) hydroxylase TrhO n=1 Tax=Dietzia sp. TaxID=1871616 RepID=UPI002FD9D72A